LPEGEGLAIAQLDRSLITITKRRRVMDSVGHHSRPDLLGLSLHRTPASQVEPHGAMAESRSGLARLVTELWVHGVVDPAASATRGGAVGPVPLTTGP
jgi:hypothetical protein